MKSAIFAATLFAVATYAQSSSSSSAASSSASEIESVSASESDMVKCFREKCNNDLSDLSCVSACSPVPNPNADMVNQTTECYKTCEGQDYDATINCRNKCINEFYNPNSRIPEPSSGSNQSSGSSGQSKSGSKSSGKSSGSNDSNDEEESSESSASRLACSVAAVAVAAVALF
ncbi:hypothetical protein EV182_000502 [Spiromyces aspiralis]|uniref:Uncharacterized protein n=1 Tax=Spiromyces aspiralis TaxID=68401 RepID=A0ACC1HUU0_9FUNG|nr:hypothetical protein EV182_000502 [Spiromyces aspiralis]